MAVIGAGFAGLWTAYYLKRADPALRVLVLEAEIAGFGAAGRNGGWVSAGIAGSRATYAKETDQATVLRAERETQSAVDEIGAVIEAEGIDCGYLKAGSLTLATSAPQAERMRAQLAAGRDFGLTDADRRLLSDDELRTWLGGAVGIVAATYTPHCARVDPARLARGLADACVARGVELYEQSPVRLLPGGEAATPRGRVKAGLIVRATESYTVTERGHRRDYLPLYSMMIATEPLSDQVWEELGWADGLTVCDKHHLYYYAQRTPDGRIALGGRGASHGLREPLAQRHETNRKAFGDLARTLRTSFPAAGRAKITHHWGGALAIPRDWCMRVVLDRTRAGATIGGFGGHGVVAANIAGRTMRDLILGQDTDLLGLPWVGHRSPRWEPEPLPYVASQAIVRILESADAYEDSAQRGARRARLVAPFLPPY